MRTWTAVLVFSFLGACAGQKTSSLNDATNTIEIPDASRYLVCKESNVTAGRKVSLVQLNGEYRIIVSTQQGQSWDSPAAATRDGDVITFSSTQSQIQAKYMTSDRTLVVFGNTNQVEFWAECTVNTVQTAAQSAGLPGDNDYYVCASERSPQTKISFVEYQGEYGIVTSTNGQSSGFMPFQIGYLNTETVVYAGKPGSPTEHLSFHLYLAKLQFKMVSTSTGEIVEKDTGSCQRFPLGQ